MLDFYNERRRNCSAAQPNAAHKALVELEQGYNVQIITQNVDDLHERAGSANVLHLHGELNKARSGFDPDYIVPCFGEQSVDDKDPNGHPMRPHIVFFGENVPMLEPAIDLVSQADVVLVIGTSLQVYPANGLVNEAPKNAQIYLIDPNPNTGFIPRPMETVKMKAGEGVPKVVAELLGKVKNI